MEKYVSISLFKYISELLAKGNLIVNLTENKFIIWSLINYKNIIIWLFNESNWACHPSSGQKNQHKVNY